MARKRKRRSIRWSTLLPVLFVANTVAGLAFSPATAARTIRVEGCQSRDRAFVERAVQGLAGIPYLRANVREIQSRIGVIDRFENVDLDSNLFGRGVLRIRYREPVATLLERPQVKLSDRGELFVDPSPAPSLPRIQLPSAGAGPNLTLAFPAELSALAEVCRRVRLVGSEGNWIVEVQEGGRLCLNEVGGGTVVLGSSENLEVKFDRLRSFLGTDPDGLKKIREMNLTAPEHPAITPLGTGG